MQHPIKDSYIASLRVGVASRAQPTSLRLAMIEIGDCMSRRDWRPTHRYWQLSHRNWRLSHRDRRMKTVA